MKKVSMKATGFLGVAFILVIGMFVLSDSLEAGIETSFRLSGSWGFLQDGAGDIDRARRGMETAINMAYRDERYTKSFNWEKPTQTNDFRVELMFRLSRNLGVSIGSGYIMAKNSGSYSIAYANDFDFSNNSSGNSTEDVMYSRNYEVSSIPITVDAYLFLPIGKKETFKIFAHAGAGYYFGRLKHTINMDGTLSYQLSSNGTLEYKNEGTANGSLTENPKDNSWGYHGGLGLDVKLTRLLSFGAEVYGRHVEFRDWEGGQVFKTEYKSTYWTQWNGERLSDDSETESAFGKMWTYEVDYANGNESYAVMGVRDEEPESRYYNNVRKSSINLNSYGFSVSIRLSFNLF